MSSSPTDTSPEDRPAPLPGAVQALRNETKSDSVPGRNQVQRMTTTEVQEQNVHLREAAERPMNVIIDLTLDGKIRWASSSWQDVIGTAAEDVLGQPIAQLLLGNTNVFAEAFASLQSNDTASKVIRFRMAVGPDSLLKKSSQDTHSESTKENDADQIDQVIDLEAQGILVYDASSGDESHVSASHHAQTFTHSPNVYKTMWMMRPAIQREVTIDLPEVLIESLGVGADMLAHYLTGLAEAGANDPANHPPPMPVLCRICERQITPWWFPKHTELCLQEHQAEAELQLAQENLTEHRNQIVKVLDGLEAQVRYKTQSSATDEPATAPPLPEYKGHSIGPASTSTSSTPSGRASPGRQTSIERSSSARPTVGHVRSRSFTVRRPLARIVELVLDLCDTALEINTPALKENRTGESDEIRTQSPQSEGRIHQVQQWQSPSAGALENEAGLTALCDDTSKLCKGKVEAVLLYRRILEYSERIRNEFVTLVQECIDAALQKASRIAAGDISSDELSDDSSTTREAVDDEDEDVEEVADGQINAVPESKAPGVVSSTSFEKPSSLAMALRQVDSTRSPSASPHRRMSSAAISSTMSTRSSSPRGGCPTPKYSSLKPITQDSRASTQTETDVANDSDSSMRSSARSCPGRSGSPASEAGPVQGTSRERKRTSLVLPRALSSSRHPSPARLSNPPPSPLRITKPRLPSGTEALKSPLMSPTLAGNEYHSPTFSSQPVSALPRHHRRQSSAASSEVSRAPLSPHLPMHPVPSQPRAVPPSIRDFEIIKPISKGAFGAVYLAKKKSTGDYYAIKALKKADMIAKNQVTNVKAERAIMMWQGESDFVAKLYWTFPSKDYVFLVMEYLNGGDCASLIRVMGTLPEDWAKRYIAEVVLGVEHLHSREIVHRDLKPDNLLIDQKGHLKLTDFGLSRMGLIGRQKRALKAEVNPPPDPLKQGHLTRATSVASSRSASFDFQGNFSPGHTPSLTAAYVNESSQQPSYFSLSREPSASGRAPTRQSSGHQSDPPEADSLSAAFRRFSLTDEPWSQTRHSPQAEGPLKEEEEDSQDGYGLRQVNSNSSSHPKHGTPPTQPTTSMPPPAMALYDPDDSNRRFVGTPDYLAPETINGLGQDEMSDWWSLGCILFEFLFGYPPFHAPTPDQVFENILQCKIDWPEDDDDNDDDEVSPQAKDLIKKLICFDPSKRLGANTDEKFTSGGEEIRNHAWFGGIDWDNFRETQPSFVPETDNPENTEYFDTRGATHHDFAAEFEDQAYSPSGTPSGESSERPHDALGRVRSPQVIQNKRGLMPLSIPPHVRESRSRRLSEPVVADDFGQFSFKNLPVLEKANKDVIQKLRAEALQAQSRSHQQAKHQQSQSTANTAASTPTLESSPLITMPDKRKMSISRVERSASPSANSHAASSPGRGSQPSSPLVQFSTGQHHERRKTSSGSSHSGSLQPGSFFDMPRLSTSLKPNSAASSPIRSARSPSTGEKTAPGGPTGNSSSPRTRSHTIGSNDSEQPKEGVPRHQKHRSQVLDVSPSSSDNDEARQKALLRVQRRRLSSRRISQISMNEGPVFRSLDILVCEDHPISRIVIEKLLEKLRCRAIIVLNGEEAMRYAMGSVKFDLIMTEFKLPQVNGSDVARMIRETKNANCHTPIVAVTGYLKELQAPHHFDALIEKPPTAQKFIEVMSRLCHWKPATSGGSSPNLAPMSILPSMPQSGLRNESFNIDESPTSTTSSSFPVGMGNMSSSYNNSSRDDSLSSASIYTDEARSEAASSLGKQPFALEEWKSGGLGITDSAHQYALSRRGPAHAIASLSTHDSAPASSEASSRPRPSAEQVQSRRRALEKERPGAGDYGDDEDEELGHYQASSRSPGSMGPSSKPRSKLSAEPMMRSDSQSSVLTASRPSREHSPSALTIPSLDDELHASATTPPLQLMPSRHHPAFVTDTHPAIEKHAALPPVREAETEASGFSASPTPTPGR